MHAPDSAPSPSPSAAPKTSKPRYTQLELIGQGVSAKVYRALDTATRSPVAIKVLNPHLRTDEISLERFQREIRITRFLNHPQVISIFDLIRGKSLALVMEYVPGYNLKDYLKFHAPLEADVALGFLKQILEVLAVCHRKNVIHRDLKPQNVIVDPHHRLKLLDFGIARMTSLADLTQTGTSLGSPEYMAPELFATNVFDPRTDLYAVGVIAYEMLTGELPFQGDSVAVLFHQHVEAPVPRLSERRAAVPGWVDDLIAKLLAKKAYERYQAADEVLADIAARRVISKSFPEVRRRHCLRCSRPTLAQLPICTFCGYDRGETFDEGAYEVVISPDAERGKLRSFLEKVFRFEGELPRRPRKLMSGIDRLSAELVKKSAFEHGLFMTVKKRFFYADALRIGSLFVIVPTILIDSAAILLFQRLMRPNPAFVSIGGAFLSVTIPVLITWGSIRFLLWTHQQPLLLKRQNLLHEGIVFVALETARSMAWYVMNAIGITSVTAGLLTFPAAAAGLAAAQHHPRASQLLFNRRPEGARPEESRLPGELQSEHGWMREIVPLLGEIKTEEQQLFVSRLIEKYYLLQEHAPGLDKEFQRNLKVLIKSAAQVAGLVSELETMVDEDVLADWSREFLTASELASRSLPSQRVKHEERASVAAARLRFFYDLDLKKAPLNARLIHLQYAFDTMLGRALVFHAALGEAETRYLEDSIAALERDLTVCREIRQELAELA